MSLRKLLSQLNLTTGSFYKHFSSKNNLFENVAEIVSKRFSENAERQLSQVQGDALDELVTLGEFIISEIESDPNLTDFLLFNPSIIPVYLIESNIDTFELLKLTHHIIAKLVKQRDLSQTENELFVKVWAFIQGYGSLISRGAVKYDRHLLLTAATQLIGEK
ncbi:hypothetical protein A7B51_00930 [Lentilactobacillus parabuchneri]|nr:hypothetical protein A7B51_00930 [Lentilactobacillus parabuchneri]OCB81848.1 hypothetical protein A8O18_00545 [Lentilactobacillus parabuchneri]OCB82509.1 hypothetical protein A7322_00550 [Lentilactobacillus parabuchneri]